MISAGVASAEQRAAYRRWIRDNHPDLGGDPEAFATGLARYRAVLRGDPGPARHNPYHAPVVIVPNSHRRRRRLARLWRRLRRRAPTRVR